MAASIVPLSSSGFSGQDPPNPTSVAALGATEIGAVAAIGGVPGAAKSPSRGISRTVPPGEQPLDRNAFIIYLLMESARPQSGFGR
jgi:hypothetical protein